MNNVPAISESTSEAAVTAESRIAAAMSKLTARPDVTECTTHSFYHHSFVKPHFAGLLPVDPLAIIRVSAIVSTQTCWPPIEPNVYVLS